MKGERLSVLRESKRETKRERRGNRVRERSGWEREGRYKGHSLSASARRNKGKERKRGEN